MDRRNFIRKRMIPAALLFTLLIAACGSNTAPSSSSMEGQGETAAVSPSAGQGESGDVSPSAGQDGSTEVSALTGKKDATADSFGDSRLQIGVAVYSLQNEYMKRFASSASEAAEDTGVTLKIYDGNYDAGLQVTQVEEMIESGVDGILLNPEDADECVACVELAQEAGIPLISVNTRVNSDQIASYVGSDDQEAGRLLMQKVADALDGAGNVVILEGPIGQSAQRERLAGMKEILQNYPGLRVISCKTANWSRSEARSVTEKWTGIFDRIDAVAAENDDMALGAMEALETATPKPVIVGIDGSEEAIRSVESGQMTATIFQNAEEQGKTAVQVMADLLRGKPIEPEYKIPLELIDQNG